MLSWYLLENFQAQSAPTSPTTSSLSTQFFRYAKLHKLNLGAKGRTSYAVPSAGRRISTSWLSCDYTFTSHSVPYFLFFLSSWNTIRNTRMVPLLCSILSGTCPSIYTQTSRGTPVSVTHATQLQRRVMGTCSHQAHSLPRAPCKHYVLQWSRVGPEPIHMCKRSYVYSHTLNGPTVGSTVGSFGPFGARNIG